MIDTIIMKFPRRTFFINEPEKFGATKSEILANMGRYKKYQNNPNRYAQVNSGYQPRLTLYTRGKVVELKVEFSAPKMLFGNNLDELRDEDFPTLVSALAKKIRERGVTISEENIRNASVSAFHPSKNIRLTKGYTAAAVIRELSKINLTQKLDLNDKDFRNGGHSLQYYSISHSLVIYDKISDLKKPLKRSIDKENRANQLSLFDLIAQTTQPEVLRIEVRLSQKQKMGSVMKELRLDEKPTLKDIFKKDVCQKIVSSYWKEMVLNRNAFLFSPVANPQTVLRQVVKKNWRIKPKEAVYLAGLYILSRDVGVRGLRTILGPLSVQRTWYRMANDFKKLDLSRHRYEWIAEVAGAIKKFEALRINGP